jgi:hypothetical protein
MGNEAHSEKCYLVRKGEAKEGDPLVQIVWSTSRHPAMGMPANRETICVSCSNMFIIAAKVPESTRQTT